MVKIDVEYICDECGKSKKEKTVIINGYEDVGYVMENKDSGYMPKNWMYEFGNDKNTLYCPKCKKKHIPKDAVWVA